MAKKQPTETAPEQQLPADPLDALPPPDAAPENIGGPRVKGPPEKVWADPLLQFFEFKHLPETGEHGDLRKVSTKFHELAHDLVKSLPRNPERTVALRKLLEAKDCAVRALIQGEIPQPGK